MKLVSKHNDQNAEPEIGAQAQLDYAEQLLQTLRDKREEFGRNIEAKNAERDLLAASVVAGEIKALDRSLQVGADIERIEEQIRSIDVVLTLSVERIVKLQSVCANEREEERRANALDRVANIEGLAVEAIAEFFVAADAMLGAYARVEDGVLQLRAARDDEHMVHARNARDSFGRLAAAHQESFATFVSKRGENALIPIVMFRKNAIVG